MCNLFYNIILYFSVITPYHLIVTEFYTGGYYTEPLLLYNYALTPSGALGIISSLHVIRTHTHTHARIYIYRCAPSIYSYAMKKIFLFMSISFTIVYCNCSVCLQNKWIFKSNQYFYHNQFHNIRSPCTYYFMFLQRNITTIKDLSAFIAVKLGLQFSTINCIALRFQI